MEEDERHISSGADKLDGVSEDTKVVEVSEERRGVEGGESGGKVGGDVERESGEEGGEWEGEREEERGEEEGERGGEERREAELERGERTDESRTSSTDDITLDTGIGNPRHPADRPLGSRDPTPPILLAPEDDDRLTGDVTTGFRAVGVCGEEEGHGSRDLGTGSHDSKMNKTELESPTASPLHSSNIHDGFVFAIHRKTVSVSETSSSPLQHLIKPHYSFSSILYLSLLSPPQFLVEQYFVASQKNRPILFGTPLVVACTPATHCRQVYEAVWRGVERLIIPDRPSADKENGYAVIYTKGAMGIPQAYSTSCTLMLQNSPNSLQSS